MKFAPHSRLLFFIAVLSLNLNSFAQDKDQPDTDPDPDQPLPTKKSKILTGLYVGSYFANKYSASTYNGYGFDVDGNRNSFLNSFMYQKIHNQYGGYGTGQFDQIAQALGVDQQQWTFTESDMPVNMHYMPAIMVGLNLKIPVLKKSSLIINLNGSKLNVEGNFTIITPIPAGTTNPAFNTTIHPFTIKGSEQRLNFQFGFQHLFGDDDGFNFFAEAGFVGTLAKYNTNTIYINNLTIDLTTYLNQNLYAAPGPTKKPIGFGVGAFAGFGINIDTNPKFTLQLLYSPSQEKVNIGTNPTLKLQNGIGFRAYYKIKGK